jgi:hypothetical protein
MSLGNCGRLRSAYTENINKHSGRKWDTEFSDEFNWIVAGDRVCY